LRIERRNFDKRHELKTSCNAGKEKDTYFIGIAIGVGLIFDGASLVGFAGAIHSLPAVQTREA
jgi:hypothetical protein